MGELNTSLPRAIQDLLAVDNDEGDGTKKSKWKNGRDNARKNSNNNNNNNNGDVVINDDQIKLGATKQYSKIISGKGIKDCVKWDRNLCMMCVRWHINGRCVKHCKHSASHVPANQVPNEKKTGMISFVKKMRELAM